MTLPNDTSLHDIKLQAAMAVRQLSDEEKADLASGSGFWTTCEAGEDPVIPSITLSDGPHGLRKQEDYFDALGIKASVPATCFPCASSSACTFDVRLLELMGRAIGEECRKEQVAINLGPSINIKRHPLGGRNFEYFSEDPLLSGKLGAAYIKGLQSVGVGASVKHLAGNNQETARMTTDSVIDERALNEIYLRGFEIAVKEAEPATVMTAYNRLNGTYCAENSALLGKLRHDWGFEGAVISDWGGMSKSVPSLAAGLDLSMPGPRLDHTYAIQQALRSKAVSHEPLNRAAERVAALALTYRHPEQPFTCDYAEHLAIAQLIAEGGGVLLKNEGALPLDPNAGEPIAVIGGFARDARYQGGGSSRINPILLDNALEAFEDAGIAIQHVEGFDTDTGEASAEQIAEAVTVASTRSTAIVFAGVPHMSESEGYDRSTMGLPETMNTLIEQVCAVNPNTVVVLSCGSPVEMPWRDSVNAILAMHLAGCQSGHATVNLLTGLANPSGRLAETWPVRLEDTALGTEFPVHDYSVLYKESIFVGYRYYEAAHVEPAFPFGHGLSYTTFAYSDLDIMPVEDGYSVSCTITNTGTRDGSEVVQIYVAPLDATVPMAPQTLAAFDKRFVPAGCSVRITQTIESEAFSYWDTEAHELRADEGTYEVRVSSSSADVRLRMTIALDASAPFATSPKAAVTSERRQALAPYFSVTPHGFTDDAFETLYDMPIPPTTTAPPFTPDSRCSELKKTAMGRLVYKAVRSNPAFDSDGSDQQKAMLVMFDETPLRGATMGGVTYTFVLMIVALLNGQIGYGLQNALMILSEKITLACRRHRLKPEQENDA